MDAKRFYYLFGSLFLSFLISSCGFNVTPKTPFEATETPQAPDYANLESWAAHPAKLDAADSLPVLGIYDQQANAIADVFFLHPTTFWGKGGWNGDLKDSKLNARTEKLAIKNQATIFNGSGRVFAPRYRQMVYGAFFEKKDPKSAQKAFMLAYSDLAHAFEYYLENENNGRPIIIAAHSQGSAHAIHLLKEYFDGKPLQNQLVAAYIPGWTVKKDTFKVLQPCNSPNSTGCYASWCSYEWETTPKHPEWYENASVVNPITWKNDTIASTFEMHQGTVTGKFNEVFPQVTESRIKDGILWVKRPKIKGNNAIIGNNFHLADFNLFWMDVRKNAAIRLDAFQIKAEKSVQNQ